jgi:TetR/AcrR family transcriptional regulator
MMTVMPRKTAPALAEHPPVRRDASATKARLLKAAVEVFADFGPRAATVDDICAKAKINKRMVYHYFVDKDDLYRQALQSVYEKFASLEVELGSMLLPAEQLLEALVRRYYRFLAEHPTFVRMISYENLNHGKMAARLDLRGQKAPVITALQLALQKGRAEGRFHRNLDATQLLVSIFGLCFFYFSNHYTMRRFLGVRAMSKAGVDARIHHVVDLLLDGICVHGKPTGRKPDA